MMVGPSAGAPAKADAAKNRTNKSEPALIRAIVRKAAHLNLALFIGDWIIEEFGCESVASGSLWQSLRVEFPSLVSCVRARATDARDKGRPRGRRRRRPVRDSGVP